jgi:hypothetical protein
MAVQTPDLPIGEPQTAPRGRARHVVFGFDDLTWAAARERGMFSPQDRLALALLDDPEVDRLLICDRPRSAPIKLAKDLIHRPLKFKSSLKDRHWQPLRWRRREPVSIAALERVYAAYDRRLRRVAERHGLERPAVITGQPLIAGFAKLEWAGPVTLYATDDLSAHPDYQPWQAGLLEAYKRVGESGRRVCAVSSAIVDRISPQGPAAVIPNGVDPAMWAAPAPAPAFPRGSIVLVGPVTERPHLAGVLTEPNVFVHEPVPRDQVASLCHAADACLLPHRRTALTEAMSPLKLYEYLSSGSPTVATDLEPVRRAGGPIFSVAPEGDFTAAVRAALAAGPADENERLAFVERNSWATRSAEVLDLALSL